MRSDERYQANMLKSAKAGAFLLIMLAALSCRTYTNFRAYYNTYYNAKKSFRQGVEEVQAQAINIDPDYFIAIYPPAPLAGQKYFEESINNSAQILHRFPKSKWLDNALLLIGKSYYYLKNYYNALERFEAVIDLNTANGLKDEAVIWKSRTFFELGLHKEGIQFLNEQLSIHKSDWDQVQKAEAKVSLASHLARAGLVTQAVKVLQPSLIYIEDPDKRARAYFLLGQLLFALNDYNKAYQAFYTSGKNSSDFEIVYYSKIKGARAAAQSGRFSLANSTYTKMLADDKYYNRRYQIMYHLGYIAELRGKTRHAVLVYKQILKNGTRHAVGDLSADIYFRLSQIYSRQFKEYQLASAYFDSSQTARAQKRKENSDNAYGKYIKFKARIAKIDSLLRLAELPPAELKSVLKKAENRSRINRNIESEDNSFMNQPNRDRLNRRNTYSSTFGFLNYKNKRLVTQDIRAFKAIWGDRALVDNWRRIEASLSLDENITQSESGPDRQAANSNEARPTGLDNTLAEIPFTPEAKRLIREQKAELQYRLGSLFFLTLNEPDSAVYYYKKVINTVEEGSALIPKSRYSLYKLYVLAGNAERARYFKSKILQKHNNTIYANLLQGYAETDSTKLTRLLFYKIINDSLSADKKARKLERLALRNTNSPVGSQIYFRSIKEYIKAAKARKDTADSSKLYLGKQWDKVRAMIEQYPVLFPKSPANEQIEAWKKMLAIKEWVFTCKELKLEPEIAGGMNNFISKIQLPPQLKAMNISGTITYKLRIGKNGEVESFELASTPTGLGIEEAYKRAITKYLHFEPVIYKGKPVQISCLVHFPVKR